MHVCESDGHLVLLDLRRDRYVALDPTHRAAFHELLTQPTGAIPDLDKIGSRMAAEGILTTELALGRSLTQLDTVLPREALLEESLTERPQTSIRHAVNFVRAVAIARMTTKVLSIEQNIARIQRRSRLRLCKKGEPFDLDLARALVASFFRLQPFMLRFKSECLFQSLVFVELFAHYGLFPNWVFGVRTSPFRAHCWVQHEHIVINDVPENVCVYTPIMIV